MAQEAKACPDILDLASVCPEEVCGGKGAQLSKLIRKGLPVPPGFILPTTIFDQHAALHNIPLEQLNSSARDLLLHRPVTADLQAAVRQHVRVLVRGLPPAQRFVSVRSSALGEDSTARSFAGMHDSVLDVPATNSCEEVLAGVVWCVVLLPSS